MGAHKPSGTQPAPPARGNARARAAAAAARRELAAAQARRRRNRQAVLVVVVAAAVLLLGWAALSWRGGDDSPAPADSAANLAGVSGLGASAEPPWPAPADVPARAEKAGLPLGAMGTAEHYHAHLDVLVNGQPATVPANIGVDPGTGAMSYLHTHTDDGLLHIEAGKQGQPFTLGQLFTQWDVRLSRTQLGALRGGDGNELTLYVNGRPRPGDPSLLRLRPHQEIALVYGPAGQQVDVPTSYDFAPGE